MTARVKNGTWRAWGGNLTAEPTVRVRPTSSDEVLRVLSEAHEQGLCARPGGSGHSCAPLVPTEGVLLDTSALKGLVSVDEDHQRVTVFAGTTLQELNLILEQHGLALANLPDSSHMSVGGALATGTHGTGLGQPSLGGQVIGLSLATPTGELISCSETHRPPRATSGSPGCRAPPRPTPASSAGCTVSRTPTRAPPHRFPGHCAARTTPFCAPP